MCFIVLFSVGCSSNHINEIDDENNSNIDQSINNAETFKVIDAELEMDQSTLLIDNAKIVIDTETGVEYLYVYDKSGYGSGCSIAMLVNTDGTPKINEAYLNKE